MYVSTLPKTAIDLVYFEYAPRQLIGSKSKNLWIWTFNEITWLQWCLDRFQYDFNSELSKINIEYFILFCKKKK